MTDRSERQDALWKATLKWFDDTLVATATVTSNTRLFTQDTFQRADKLLTQDTFQRADKLIERVIEDLGESPAPLPAEPARELSEDDKALHRALRFGRPQIMGGRGQWDNARYMPSDED